MADRHLSFAFGTVVQKHRKAKGLSQEALAERADIHHTHVGLIERGERNASLNVADRMARAFGMQLSTLIREAEEALAISRSRRRPRGSSEARSRAT